MRRLYGLARLALKSRGRDEGIEGKRAEFIESVLHSLDNKRRLNEKRRKEASVYLEDMADRFDPEFHAKSGEPIGNHISKFLDDIHIENAPKQGGEVLVFFSNHRSMLDFLIQGVKFIDLDINPTRYSAGKNLNASLLNDVLRKWGGVAVDRSNTNPIYLACLMEYFSQVILSGTNVVIYPEAGRSYNGRFKELKGALMQSVISAHEGKPGLDYRIIVATISYNRTAEDYLLARAGERKGKNSHHQRVADLLSGFEILLFKPPKCGNAYLTFGEPFCLDEIEGESAKEKRAALVSRVNKDFRELYKVTASNVAAYSMDDGKMEIEKFEGSFYEAIDKLKRANANLEECLRVQVEIGMVLGDPYVRRLIKSSRGILVPRHKGLIDYYGNSVRSVLNEG